MVSSGVVTYNMFLKRIIVGVIVVLVLLPLLLLCFLVLLLVLFLICTNLLQREQATLILAQVVCPNLSSHYSSILIFAATTPSPSENLDDLEIATALSSTRRKNQRLLFRPIFLGAELERVHSRHRFVCYQIPLLSSAGSRAIARSNFATLRGSRRNSLQRM